MQKVYKRLSDLLEKSYNSLDDRPVIPPDLVTAGGYTFVFSGPTPPTQEQVDEIVNCGIPESNILWVEVEE